MWGRQQANCIGQGAGFGSRQHSHPGIFTHPARVLAAVCSLSSVRQEHYLPLLLAMKSSSVGPYTYETVAIKAMLCIYIYLKKILFQTENIHLTKPDFISNSDLYPEESNLNEAFLSHGLHLPRNR